MQPVNTVMMNLHWTNVMFERTAFDFNNNRYEKHCFLSFKSW